MKGFPCGSAGKESACNVGDLGLIPGLGRSPGEGKGYPLQYSGLENSKDYPWGLQRDGHDWETFTESWTIKKAERRRTDAFELWCWRRLFRVPWTAGRSNQSILKEINPVNHWKDWCWSWNSNTSATWCKELTHWKGHWSCKRLKVGGEGDDRGWYGWMASPTQWTWVWVSSGSWWWTGRPGVLQSMGSQRVGHDWVIKLSELNWTTFTRNEHSGRGSS